MPRLINQKATIIMLKGIYWLSGIDYIVSSLTKRYFIAKEIILVSLNSIDIIILTCIKQIFHIRNVCTDFLITVIEFVRFLP